MSDNMKEYVRMIQKRSVNIIVNPFAAPVNVEEFFVDISEHGLKVPTHGGNFLNVCVLVITFGFVFVPVALCFLFFFMLVFLWLFVFTTISVINFCLI